MASGTESFTTLIGMVLREIYWGVWIVLDWLRIGTGGELL
jgi:hypothetical protein